MTEKAFIIGKINEAANAILESLPLCDRLIHGDDFNGVIVSTMGGKSYIKREVVYSSVFFFVNRCFDGCFDRGEEEGLRILKELYARALEIDRLISLYKIL